MFSARQRRGTDRNTHRRNEYCIISKFRTLYGVGRLIQNFPYGNCGARLYIHVHVLHPRSPAYVLTMQLASFSHDSILTWHLWHNRFLEVSVKQSNYIFTTTTRISSSTNLLQINLSIFTNNELLLDTIHLITTMLLCLNYNTRMHLESNHVSIKLD